MSLTKITYTDGSINPLSELNSFVTATAGWVIDKYIVDDELYINHTAVDGTIGYYSFKFSQPDVRYGRITCYNNTGFDTGQAVDTQPGVFTNSTPAVSAIYVDIGSSSDKKAFSIIIGTECIMLQSKRTISMLSVNVGYSAYLGILKKPISYVGGRISYGSHKIGVSPNMIIFYEGTWYSNDGGIFIATVGQESYFDKISFSDSEMFSFNTRSIKLRSKGVYIETATGADTFEYVGDIQDIHFSSKLSNMRINSTIQIGAVNYHVVPWSSAGGTQTVYNIPGV